MEPTIKQGDKIVVDKLALIREMDRPKRGDIVVLKNLYKDDFSKSSMYVKRIIGLPGDTISISDGFYIISRIDTLSNFGNTDREAFLGKLKNMFGHRMKAFPYCEDYKWTIAQFGPYYIPKKGRTILIDKGNYILYKTLIESETGKEMRTKDGIIYLGYKEILQYEFKKSYYFVVGDNFLDSKDSRHFGPVSESCLIGIGMKIRPSHP